MGIRVVIVYGYVNQDQRVWNGVFSIKIRSRILRKISEEIYNDTEGNPLLNFRFWKMV